MKKIMAVLLTVCLCIPVFALAEDKPEAVPEEVTANGVVKCENVYQITAPYSGVIDPFDWETGDEVKKGETLFTMNTNKVYAPQDGKVTAVFAKEGDLCEDVMNQYGMILSMEKKIDQKGVCTTAGAHNDPDNRFIHVGEKIYFCELNDRNNQGEGRVISVDGKNYVFEVTKGDFDDNDDIKIYRDEKLVAKSCIGSGKVARDHNVSAAGSGRVIKCHVIKDQEVKKGQLLFELASPDAEKDTMFSNIKSPVNGAVEITAAAGSQQVYKGEVLCKVHDLSSMQIIAEVDEMDLDRIQVGDTCTVELDRYPEKRFNASVEKIAKIGIAKQNATYYNVTLNVTTNAELLPGMNATVYLPELAE